MQLGRARLRSVQQTQHRVASVHHVHLDLWQLQRPMANRQPRERSIKVPAHLFHSSRSQQFRHSLPFRLRNAITQFQRTFTIFVFGILQQRFLRYNNRLRQHRQDISRTDNKNIRMSQQELNDVVVPAPRSEMQRRRPVPVAHVHGAVPITQQCLNCSQTTVPEIKFQADHKRISLQKRRSQSHQAA